MGLEIDERYREPLGELVTRHGLDDLSSFLAVSEYEETPLYLRYSELDFMRGLSFRDQNRLLIVTAALQIREVTRQLLEMHGPATPRQLFMVSVSDWWQIDSGVWKEVDGSNGLLTPAIWFGDFESNALRGFHPAPPSTVGSTFVEECLRRDSAFALHEGISNAPGGPYLERVYVRIRSVPAPWQE
jgi:hypothetical protein